MSHIESQHDSEEILLRNPTEPVFPDDELQFNSVSVKFLQADRANLESKNFKIYDNTFLNISSFRKNIKQQYWVNLAFVNPKPRRKFIVSRFWCVVFFAFLILTVIATLAPLPEPVMNMESYRKPAMTLALTMTLISVVMLLGRLTSKVYLYSVNGAIPMIELLYNNPNKAAYQQFLRHICLSAENAKAKNDFEHSQQLAAELTEHRRLRDQGILSQESYDNAKQKIFSLHSNPAPLEKILPY